jgi:Fic family protein
MKRPQNAPTLQKSLAALPAKRTPAVLAHLSGPTIRGRYFHWDELKRRTPPDDLSLEEWWMTLKVARAMGRRFLPFVDKSNMPFSYILTDEALALLNRIDRFASGRIGAPQVITDATTRDRYLVSSLMEEAISSSLLEGAATTRTEGKALLRSGRAPRTRGELMVVNNYRTMQFIRDDLDRELTVDMVLDPHRMITEGTLDNPDDAGRIQQPGDERVVVGDPDDASVIFHVPPPAEQLPDLLNELVAFANASDEEPFVHPVVRAVALHFYLSYLHPFVDGNGRTARALFYRSMLRQGYWLAEFLSISRLLYRAPAQYGRAFLYTETDEADFTYFLLHQLGIVSRSIDELLEHLERKVSEVRKVEQALRSTPGLNHRQLALLSHALRHPDAVYTFESHRNSHNVTYQTARADLLDLEALHLLERGKVGRQYRFYPAADLADRVLGQ